MQDHRRTLQHELAHVYWIGGSPCAGKSSIAAALAAKYGLYLYQADEAYFRHEKIVTPEQQPTFYHLTHCTSEELWMRPVEQQVLEEVMLYHEEFPLILEELLALPKSQGILAEGAAFLSACVLPLLFRWQQALWLVPAPAFQIKYYESRAWARDVVKSCTDPEQAFQNWMQRDIRFAQYIKREAQRQAMRVFVVDGTHSLAENISTVERHFQLA